MRVWCWFCVVCFVFVSGLVVVIVILGVELELILIC